MLQIILPADECWDEQRNEFVQCKETTLQLEHSLVSLSKWEAKYCKAFLNDNNKSTEETIDYIRFMTLTKNVKPDAYYRLSPEHIKQIQEYINAPMTATWFAEDQTQKPSREIITAELIYYWMISFQIPFECQKWHLNRLLTLIRVCNVKNAPPKKMSKRDIMSRNAALNAARRKQFNTNG